MEVTSAWQQIVFYQSIQKDQLFGGRLLIFGGL